MQEQILPQFDSSNLAGLPATFSPSALNPLSVPGLLSSIGSPLLAAPNRLSAISPSETALSESGIAGLLPGALPFSPLPFSAQDAANDEVSILATGNPFDSLTGQATAAADSASGLETDTFGRSPLPLSFVANAGQADESVAFHARGAGHTLFFTDNSLYLSATQSVGDRSQTATVGLTFVGSQAAPALTGTSPLTSSVNFLRGNDLEQWQTQVSTYGGLVYQDLYDGIDLSYSGEEGILKSEFVVHPGADPSDIQLAYSGIEGMSLRADGALVLQTPFGELVETAPLLYQIVNGEQVAVEGRYQLLGDNQVGFAVGDYDPDYALVIDPVPK